MRSRQPRKNGLMPTIGFSSLFATALASESFCLTRKRYMRGVAEIWQVSNKRMTALRDISARIFHTSAELFRWFDKLFFQYAFRRFIAASSQLAAMSRQH